jgi:hypothetical protein
VGLLHFAQRAKRYLSCDTSLSTLQSQTSKHRIANQQTTHIVCFGERTTFVCPACENKSWETKWYTFGAEAGKCVLGNPLGSCTDPYMAYHQEYKYCVTCLVRLNDDQQRPQTPSETFHPDDHDHEHPQLLHYEASEQHTLKTTGELTMPMKVARELNRHSGLTPFYAAVPENRLMYEISNIIRNRKSGTSKLQILFEPIMHQPQSPLETEASMQMMGMKTPYSPQQLPSNPRHARESQETFSRVRFLLPRSTALLCPPTTKPCLADRLPSTLRTLAKTFQSIDARWSE